MEASTLEKGRCVKFTLPGLPPSVNHSHFARGRKLKPETSKWMKDMGLMMRGQMHGQDRLDFGADLELRIRLYGNWSTSKGTARRTDLSNRIKILEDTVAKVCGFDDSAVIFIQAAKVPADAERTEVEVWEATL